MNKKAKRVTPIKLLCLVMAVMTVGALLLGALTRASYRHDVADAAKSPDTKILYRQKGSLEDEKGGDGGLKETLLKADIIVRANRSGRSSTNMRLCWSRCGSNRYLEVT